MQDPFPIPSCFSATIDKSPDHDPTPAFASNKPGQSVVASVYRTKIAGHSRLITVTWCANLLAHGLCVSVEATADATTTTTTTTASICKIELRPWSFWRKTGSKKFSVQGKAVHVVWDLRNAKFRAGEPEPRANYYVALVHDAEVVLLLGDLKADAYRRTGFRPSAIEATLVSKKEHVYGKRRFATRSRFHDKGRPHDISIECGVPMSSSSSDPEMVVTIDGSVAVRVKHLHWKFRGNETVVVSKSRVEIFWDVHDWLFVSPGLRHALFIFKPLPTPHSSVLPNSSSSLPTLSDGVGVGLFLYAWKLE